MEIHVGIMNRHKAGSFRDAWVVVNLKDDFNYVKSRVMKQVAGGNSNILNFFD